MKELATTYHSGFLEFERLSKCPACDHADIPTAVEPDIARCSACHLYFRNPRPTQEEIARSYDTGGTFAAWQEEETARAAMWERRLTLVRRYAARGRLLDVGAGDGRFLISAKATGYQVTGTEVSRAGVDYARQRGVDIHLGQITDLHLPKVTFDLATIWHVLEHVPEPAAVLREVYGLLRPGGILVLAVPNEDNYLFQRRFGKAKISAPFGALEFGGEIHLTYFQPSTLRTALCAAGYEFVKIGVDDAYYIRDWKMQAKLILQQSLAFVLRWHFAVAMYAIARRPNS